MTGILIIFGITYILIATEKIETNASVFLGVAAAVLFGYADYGKMLQSIDVNVIYLLVGMMIIMGILAKTGVFEWLAIVMAQKAKGDGVRIMFLFLIATAFISSVLDNVTTVILIAPVTILVTQILEIPTAPLLILEAVFSNIGGTATLIGDPPNVVIGSRAGLSFNDFLFNMSPAIAVIMIISLAILYPLMRKQLYVPETIRKRVMAAFPEKAIIDAPCLKRSLPVLCAVLLGFLLGRLFHIEAGLVAIAGALTMAVICRVSLHQLMEKVDWLTIFFFMGLFMLVGALEQNGVFEMLSGVVVAWSGGSLLVTCMVILWAGAIISAFVNNVPLVIAMIPLLDNMKPAFAQAQGITDPALIHSAIACPMYWALALGVCLGGNGTLIGASANVVVSQIAQRNRCKLSFWDFTRYGFPLMIVSMLVSTAYLYLRYF